MRKKYNWPYLFFGLFLILSLTACRSNNEDSQTTMDSKSTNFNTMEAPAEEIEDDAMNEEIAQETSDLELGEKVIETASLDYETIHFQEAVDFINQQIEEYDGQLENTSQGEGTSSYGFTGKYINLTVRIPEELLHDFIQTLNEDKNLYIQHQDIGQTDASKIYRDNETRIDILKEEEETLREMLKEQEELENVLEIRTRLTEIVTEREIFESENKNIDEQVDYSTVYIYLQQTDQARTQNIQGFWSRLSAAFVDSFYRFIAVSQQVLIGAVYFIPYLFILGILGTIAFVVIRKNRKK